MLALLFITATLGCPSDPRDALLQLYAGLGGSDVVEHWPDNESYCSWKGVTCTRAGAITELDFSGWGLTGSIPAVIKCFPHLKSLYLMNNALEGHIPHELCELTNLQYMQLGENRLQGSIPECVCNMRFLQHFHAAGNMLTGGVPACMGGLPFLRELHLTCNNLTGELPESFVNASEYLAEVYVDCNPDFNCTAGKYSFIFLCGLENCDTCIPPTIVCPSCKDTSECGRYCKPETARRMVQENARRRYYEGAKA